jgi:Zn-dependent protease with chaperone function
MTEARQKQRVLLQAGAMRRPTWFRIKVALAAVAGEAAAQLALVPALALLLLAVVSWPQQALSGALALAALLVLWWVLHPQRGVPGRSIDRAAAPRLHALVDRLAQAARSPRIDDIRIDDGFNAGALSLGRWSRPWRKHRILVLGGPLLATVSPSALKAIIAHELGHFSRDHGRLGHWVHQARRSWLDAAAASGAPTVMDRAAASFARWVAPRFDLLAFEHSRQCEHEADASAARAVGPLTLAAALAETQWAATLMAREAQAFRHQLMRALPRPPADLWQRQGTQIRRRMAGGDWLDRAWADPASWTDSHPGLQARARALGFGRGDVRAALQACRRWEPDATHAEALAAAGAQLTPGEIFEWELGHRRLRSQGPLDAHWRADAACRRFRAACRLADRGDTASLPLLAGLLERDPSWTAPARLAMARLGRRSLSEPQLLRNQALLARAEQKRALAVVQATARLHAMRSPAPAPVALAGAALRAALQEQDVVTAGAWGQFDVPDGAPTRRHRVIVLWLRLDAAAMRQRQLADDDVLLALQAQLEALFPPNVVTTLVTSPANETPPAWAGWLRRVW